MFSIDDLHQKFPNCILMSLECYQCPRTFEKRMCLIHENIYRYEWLQTIECGLCRNTWYVCKTCIVKRRFVKRSQVLSHHKNFHLGKNNESHKKSVDNKISGIGVSGFLQCDKESLSSAKNDDNFDDDYADNTINDMRFDCPDNMTQEQNFVADYNSFFVKNYVTSSDLSDDEEINSNFDNINYKNIDNVNMFRYWLAKDKHIEYLTGRSLFNKFSGYESITKSSSTLNLKLFSFVNSLTNNQKQSFADILKSISPEMIHQNNEKKFTQQTDGSLTQSGNAESMILPTSMKNLRAMYVDGNNSLKKILPNIEVEMDGIGNDEHSYISFRDCIDHYLLFGGYGIKNIPSTKNICCTDLFTSKAFEQNLIISTKGVDDYKPMMIIPFVLFSDDFDPTVSIVTANRKGVWIYTCSFKSQDPFDNERSKTYILAMGNKGADHQPILKKIEKEINSFRVYNPSERFYHCYLKKKLTVISFPLVRHGDQPERRSINFLKLGKQSNHARWRHSLDIKNAGKYLPSCDYCQKKINCFFQKYDLDRSLQKPTLTCTECTNWSFDPLHIILHTSPPKNFPIDQVPCTGKLPPLILTKENIKTAIVLSYNNLKIGVWTKSNVTTYLSYLCIKTSVIEQIIYRGHNAYLLHILNDRKIQNTEQLSFEDKFLLDDHKNNSHLYDNIPFSCIIEESMDDIDTYPDSPMHLLSGYVKATMHLMFLFLKKNSYIKSFFEILNKERLVNHIDNMKVGWLPIIPYKSEGFTGFKCSNYLSLGRLLKVHTLILYKIKEKDHFKFPETHHKNWNMTTNKKWLSQNGYTTHGNAQTLRERVKKFMPSKTDSTPKRKNEPLTMDVVIRMMVSVYNSLCYLTHGTIDEHHSSITLFTVIRSLNDIEILDGNLRLSTSQPIWHIKYNLLCLLNCPEDMMKFGPITDRWEGSMEGEKCIQNVKKNFSGFRKGYLKVLHENYNIDQTLHNIQRMSNLSEGKNELNETRKQFNTYRHVSSFLSSLMLHRPIVCYQVSIKNITEIKYGFLSQTANIHLLKTLQYMSSEKYCHLFNVKVYKQLEDDIIIERDHFEINDCLIGIPFKTNDEESERENNLYTFISKNGMELYPDLTLKLPVM